MTSWKEHWWRNGAINCINRWVCFFCSHRFGYPTCNSVWVASIWGHWVNGMFANVNGWIGTIYHGLSSFSGLVIYLVWNVWTNILGTNYLLTQFCVTDIIKCIVSSSVCQSVRMSWIIVNLLVPKFDVSFWIKRSVLEKWFSLT